MTKSVLLAITLLACTAWMAAQSTSPSSQSPSSSGSAAGSQTGSQTGTQSGSQTTGQTGSENGQMSGSSGAQGESHTTLRGCLSSSGGGYTLTDASGTQYQLTGDTSKLSKNVNNEVEVKGSAAGAGASGYGNNSAGSQAGSQTSTGAGASGQMFNVTKVKKLSGTCSNSGNTGGTNR